MSVDASAEERYSPQAEAQQVARATALIALGNISSRVLGLGREIFLSNLFGASLAVDAFKIAIIVPRGVYDLLIGGHVNSALIPVLSAYAEKKDRAELWNLVSALLTLMVIVMSALVLLIQLFAPTIIEVVASSEASPEKIAQATDLLQITNPALIFMSLFAVTSSVLYALQRFTAPAFAASVFNLTIVLTLALLSSSMGITAAALGWLLGAIMQLGVQWLGLYGTQMRLRFRLWHPAVRTVTILYAPVMLSLAIDVFINRAFSYNLASQAGEGSVSYMDWATTLMQFPHGLVATAISIAVLPTLSRQASAESGLGNFKNTLGFGMRLSLALITPATIGLFVLANPVVALIFEHGEFTPEDTAITALALRLYLIGLPFAALDLLLVFAFYARQDTLTPALIGLLSLVAYIATAIYLQPQYSFYSLMIADALKHIVHAGVSGYILLRRIDGLPGQKLIQTAVRALMASLMMGAVAFGLQLALRQVLDGQRLLDELLLVGVAGGVSGLMYLALARRLGVGEINTFFMQLRQRL